MDLTLDQAFNNLVKVADNQFMGTKLEHKILQDSLLMIRDHIWPAATAVEQQNKDDGEAN